MDRFRTGCPDCPASYLDGAKADRCVVPFPSPDLPCAALIPEELEGANRLPFPVVGVCGTKRCCG